MSSASLLEEDENDAGREDALSGDELHASEQVAVDSTHPGASVSSPSSSSINVNSCTTEPSPPVLPPGLKTAAPGGPSPMSLSSRHNSESDAKDPSGPLYPNATQGNAPDENLAGHGLLHPGNTLSRRMVTHVDSWAIPVTPSLSEGAPIHQDAARPPTANLVSPLFGFKNAHRRSSKGKTRKPSIMSNFVPEKPVGEAPVFWQGLKAIVFASWLNILLIFILLSWAFNWAKPDSHILIFVFSFLAMIPLANLLALVVDELAIRVGHTLAALLHVTVSNAVEFIVAIIAVVKCQLQVVQSSLMGAILCKCLLGLGLCFFTGGLRYQEQGFGAGPSQINSSLLALSVIAVLLPGAFHLSIQPDSRTIEDLTTGQEGSDIKKLSHGVAIILLFIYGSYLVFQLWSHSSLYDDKHESNFRSTKYDPGLQARARYTLRRILRRSQTDEDAISDCAVACDEEAEEEEEKPMMSFLMCISLLIVVTGLLIVTGMWLVDSIDGLADDTALNKQWVALILLPIVGNAAEHATTATVSIKDKLTTSIAVAVGSSIQIALCIIPFVVFIAWCLGKPLLMLFDPFESVTLFLSVLAVNCVVQDGKSNWLEGMILMCLYVIIGVSFYFYPGSDIANALAQCT